MLISWLAKWGYIIHKISKLIFNRIFTKENKIFIQIIWTTVIALHVYSKIISNNRFQTDRTRLVQFQRWANLDYNSKLEPWQKKTIKSNVPVRDGRLFDKIFFLPLQFSSYTILRPVRDMIIRMAYQEYIPMVMVVYKSFFQRD